MRYFVSILLICISSLALYADDTDITSDSIVVSELRKEGITFTHDNDVKLLMTGQEKFDDMFEAIRNARQSVHLEYFNFRNDSIAMLLFDILAEKAKEGVEIRALYDAFGNSSNNQPLKSEHVKKLRERGIQIYEFDPIKFPWLNHIFGRDHRKIVVIDGEIAYTGGMNVADYYIKGTPVVGAWRDMHCRLVGSEVNTLQKIFLRAWHKVTGEIIVDRKYFNATKREYSDGGIALKGDMMCGIVNREPHLSPKAVRQFYLHSMDAAQDTIRLINPYFTLIPKIRKAILRAVKRGVVVQIMVAEPSDIPLTPDCVFYNVNKLQKKGCQVWVYQPGFHHTKIIMVDGEFCTVGSTNLDARSLKCDYEENVAIIDKSITKQLSDMFDSDKKESFRLTKGVYKKWRTPWQRFRGWFAHLLSPLL
ncbi:MAG: phospholipase D-like domain-containing protein [Bacteroidales bacterium]|nr:phospholipase D-like domain-containing protein [Bacteroidales bacterium]MCM1147693.1 phospholipase D-like domain-containing protein [Bacteroidales bacterium]MCM1206778.1 phospholipase D-like domain-containing protein [Bacillota bacterium]MCM1510678.1 phospholipase D-like domain-containing protein [Clostridium sp.]